MTTKSVLLLTLWCLLCTTAWASAVHRVIVAPAAHGSIAVSPTEAAEGTTVTAIILAETDYQLREGSLVVEKVISPDEADVAGFDLPPGRRVPGVGDFVPVTQTGEDTYTFRMPDTDVMVYATFEPAPGIDIHATETEGDQPVTGITIRVRPNGEGTVAIVEVVVPEDLRWTPIIIYLPAEVTDADGRTLTVTEIAPRALFGRTNIIGIYMPDTDEAIWVQEEGFLLDEETGDAHHVPFVHTPLWLLDDYSLMASLHEQYAARLMRATATAAHRYWTFSCGVDVTLPDGVGLYVCRQGGKREVYIWEIEEATVIKANNGVLLACPDNEGHSYEVEAVPSADRPSGMEPPTHDARTYEGNLMVPAVVATHYDRGGYYVLSNNVFHDILQESASARVPACRAVLHLPASGEASAIVETRKP